MSRVTLRGRGKTAPNEPGFESGARPTEAALLNFIGNVKILSDSFNHFVWRPGATQPTQRIKKKWSEVFNELRALFFLSFFLLQVFAHCTSPTGLNP